VPQSVHEALCRGLGTKLGQCDAKVSDNDMLWLPGTWNHKTNPPSPVTWVQPPKPGITPLAPNLVAKILGVNLRSARAQNCRVRGIKSRVDPARLDDLPALVRAALAEITGHRAVDTMRVVGACYDAGLTLDETRAAVATREDLEGRLAERKDDDLLECWHKVDDDRRCRLRRPRRRTGTHARRSGLRNRRGHRHDGPPTTRPHRQGKSQVGTATSNFTRTGKPRRHWPPRDR
jgi:hypothetical protein